MKRLINILSGIKSTRADRKIRFCALVFTIIFIVSAFSTILFTAVDSYADDYLVNSYDVNVRSGPGTIYTVLGSLTAGDEVSSVETAVDEDGNIWYGISYNGEMGYISADCADQITITTEESTTEEETEPESELPAGEEETAEPSDKDETESETSEEETSELEEIEEEEEVEEEALEAYQPSWSGYVQSDAEFEASLSQFPESYRAGLRAIHAVYPNYTFTADYVGMDFESVVDEEIGKKVSSNSANSWRAMYDESYGWYENYDWDTGEWIFSEGFFTYASREVIEYYLDPRNFLDTDNIYMFMNQSYSSSQSVDDLRSMVQGTFLASGYVPNKNDADDVRLKGDYCAVLMEAAQYSGVSPFVLATTILMEQGRSGSAPLAAGYYLANDGTEYDGYFNFYDIGATGSDNDNVIQNGMEYAVAQGWTSRYKCLVYGATWYADGYTSNGQNTYYYREFNVINGWDALWHQYATAIVAAQNSSAWLKSVMSGYTYAAIDFRIPVYDNMPATPVSEPDYDEKLNNYYFTDMQASGLEPTFSMANHDYTMVMTGNATLSIAVPKWATYQGYSSYAIYQGTNTVNLSVMSQTGYLRTYTITVTASKNCTLYVDTYVGNRLNISDSDSSGSGSSSASWGDANGDGKVSALDYIAIKKHIMGTAAITNSVNLSAADTNGDGKVSALDYIAIKKYIMSK